MAGPNYGALGATFKIVRLLQAVCMIAIIGITANFISEIVTSNKTPPQELVGTLSVICIAVLYCAITFILFMDDILPFFINTGIDSLMLIALIVISVTVGKPISYMNCLAIGNPDSTTSAYDYAMALGKSLNQNGASLDFALWSGATRANCLETKAIWGLSISLCILFAFSGICSLCLWRRKPALVKEAA